MNKEKESYIHDGMYYLFQNTVGRISCECCCFIVIPMSRV